MNVLILTPDRVGSTLLQRIITVCMQLHTYDKPVINLHELTNGLIKNFNQCVDVYNEWSRKNNLGKLYTDEQIAVNMSKELPAWHQQLTLAQ